jgi:PAS domain S-box-containing protein
LNSAVATGIITLDRRGLVTGWSEGAYNLLGWTEEEMLGQTLERIFPPGESGKELLASEMAEAAKIGRGTHEGWRQKKDGAQVWAVGEMTPFFDHQPEPIGFVKILRDLTDMRQAELNLQRQIEEREHAEKALRDLNRDLEAEIKRRTDELETAAEALRQSQKMEAVGQLTGGIAHDFNNLLQIIVVNLETLLRNLPSEMARHRRASSQAMSGAKRAAALTQRLLAFARRQPLDPKPVDANALIHGMSDLLNRSLGETIHMETVLGAGLWRTEADPNELENSLLNLAVNARDAMPNGGKLTIETANAYIDRGYASRHIEVIPGQYVLISVSDTGIGMDEETISHVFEPFFTTKAEGKGTGLGLGQVYGFVKQTKGHVKVYSESGEGTTVKIYLPRLIGDVAIEGTNRTAPIPDGVSGETILVVDRSGALRLRRAFFVLLRQFKPLGVDDACNRLARVSSPAHPIDKSLKRSKSGFVLTPEIVY